jgi:hypothetical protein
MVSGWARQRNPKRLWIDFELVYAQPPNCSPTLAVWMAASEGGHGARQWVRKVSLKRL